MGCSCKNHLEQFTCSGVDCQVCVLGEENYIENPEPTRGTILSKMCNEKRRIYYGRVVAIDDGKS